jgi:7,8-dihydropterin-6-yl-methyl-4-(beta-D-ribofuranosyl)aminobenzene 5'-phosphate synthase
LIKIPQPPQVVLGTVIKMKKLFAVFLSIWMVTVGAVVSNAICAKRASAEEQSVLSPAFGNMHATAVKQINITVVYDNNPYREGLTTSWGFSCLISGTEKTILFDTGGNGFILLENMKRLGIAPGEIELLFLSHEHGDHIRGLAQFLEANNRLTVFLPASFPERFKIGLKSRGIKIAEVQHPTKICEAVFSTGLMGTGLKEQSLILHTDRGPILITGCAHPGIIHIIEEAKNLIRDDVLLVMGGFHLAGMRKPDLEKIITRFKQAGVKHVGPCHCSGNLARAMFKEAYQKNYIDVGVGRVLEFQ